MPYGVGVRVPLSAQRSLRPGLLFRCLFGVKERKSLYVAVFEGFGRFPEPDAESNPEKTPDGKKAGRGDFGPPKTESPPRKLIMSCYAVF